MDKRIKKSLLALLLSACVPVCVNAAQTDTFNTILQENTAFSLGIEESDFSISNLREQGVKTSYQVNTRSGKQYRCYVTGYAGNVTGPVVSDAMCQEKGKPFQNPLLR